MESIQELIFKGNIHHLVDELHTENISNTSSLRKFHNLIKSQLIFNAKRNTNGENLLDIACGRGGDIIKWSISKFKFVTAFDSDKKSIYESNDFDGAIKRFKTIKSTMYTPKCFFWNFSAIDPNILNNLNSKDLGKIYDVISCQFAIHYFVNDIDILLNMVSKKIKVGGLFIGTTVDGDLLNLNLKNGNIDLPFLRVYKESDYKYTYEIINNGVNETYYDYRGALPEYFVFKDKLIEKCKEYSLELVSIKNFHEWKETINTNLSKNEEVISFLNFSFVFKKVTQVLF